MGTILVVHDELNSLELPVFKKDDGSKPELRYFPGLHEVHVCSIHQAVVDITSKRVVIQSIERDLVLRILVVVLYTERGSDIVRFRSYIPN